MHRFFYSFWIGFGLWTVSGNFLPIFGEELRNLPEARIPLDEGKKLEPGELAEKKEGWYVTAVPLLSSDPVRGQGGGIRASLFFNGKKTDLYYEYEAYRSKLTFQLFQTNEGIKNHFIQFDSPYILNTAFRWKSSLGLDFNPNSQYFGIGESSLQPLSYRPRNLPGIGHITNASFDAYEASQSYIRPSRTGSEITPTVSDQGYNQYLFNSTTFFNSIDYTFWKAWKWVIANEISKNIIGHSDGIWNPSKDPYLAGSIWNTSVPNGESKLTEDYKAGRIIGYSGGEIVYFRAGLAYDTRDFEPDPDRGTLIELNMANVSKRTGSDFNYNKIFFQTKYFYKILPDIFEELVFATRDALGYTSSGAPFSEVRYMWSLDGSMTGIGGLQTMRGYRQDRFVAPVVGFGSAELRWRFATFKISDELFTFSFVPFYDLGRVWDSEKRINFQGYKHSWGGGLRIIWNQATVILIDFAESKEDTQMFVDFNHAF
ncbi:Omp85 family outer membrane protein [Leptospira borgpetersenii]|uniref:Omp85 family outer membrane protein n=1 Tax=Leptospira borgpetersenii TaxID=174 RepID=UPI001882EB4D|nr:DUF5982 domain-containing protein [Leptospira borgpetersenii]MBE8364656.1 BamA/TamA family outer membrane protein [Leptospira borgpetersenii serovar Balcanica]MBE8366211.1 BamA/TamA family outer membrane protein [Leptospira borgpetersenii serovar Balcanica]MBE8423692.1 BamA/TamA family outer membrane protein [Leptospira borgpetersenii serovar Balcanica]MBF3350804.1 BamA/TamA family outer membrane protein [Leptospira borgpetersenii serovar Balcanica]